MKHYSMMAAMAAAALALIGCSKETPEATRPRHRSLRMTSGPWTQASPVSTSISLPQATISSIQNVSTGIRMRLSGET